MPEILVKGDGDIGPQWVKVDRRDLPLLSRYIWRVNQSGYVYRNTRASIFRGRSGNLFLHREIMGLPPGWPLQVDHLNGNPLDNRRTNLERVTKEENLRRRDSSGGGRV